MGSKIFPTIFIWSKVLHFYRPAINLAHVFKGPRLKVNALASSISEIRLYKKGKQNKNADALSRAKSFHNSIESLIVNYDDNENDDIINQIFYNTRREVENMPNVPNQSLASVTDCNTYINQDDDAPIRLPTTAESETASTTSAGPRQLISTHWYLYTNRQWKSGYTYRHWRYQQTIRTVLHTIHTRLRVRSRQHQSGPYAVTFLKYVYSIFN